MSVMVSSNGLPKMFDAGIHSPMRFAPFPCQSRSVLPGPRQAATSAMPALARSAASQAPSSVPLAPHQLASMPIEFRAGAAGRKKRILCYGDSLTVGFCSGGTQFTPYGRALIEALAALGYAGEVSVCGHSGITAKAMLASSGSTIVDVVGGRGKGLTRILKEDGTFDFVVIMAGTNDMGAGIPQGEILEDLRALHQICHKHGTPTVALAPPPAPGLPPAREMERRCFSSRFDKMCSEMGGIVASFDPADFVPIDHRAYWERDGLHLSPAGSQALGHGLASVASKYLSEESPGVDTFRSQNGVTSTLGSVHTTSTQPKDKSQIGSPMSPGVDSVRSQNGVTPTLGSVRTASAESKDKSQVGSPICPGADSVRSQNTVTPTLLGSVHVASTQSKDKFQVGSPMLRRVTTVPTLRRNQSRLGLVRAVPVY